MSIKGGKPNDRRIAAHLMVPNGAEAIDYYRRAFGAETLYASELPGGRVVHAQLRVWNSVLLLTEESLREEGEASANERFGTKLLAPRSLGGTTTMLEIYVDDVDDTFRRAAEAGGRVVLEPQEMFYGDRYGILADPFGHLWAISTVVEELTPEEVNRRAMAMFAPA